MTWENNIHINNVLNFSLRIKLKSWAKESELTTVNSKTGYYVILNKIASELQNHALLSENGIGGN